MLGVKSTCKDRWRQVLAEANRIEHKHLLTFEAAISSNQTDEMRTKNLQLVVPRRLHDSYTETQRAWLMDGCILIYNLGTRTTGHVKGEIKLSKPAERLSKIMARGSVSALRVQKRLANNGFTTFWP